MEVRLGGRPLRGSRRLLIAPYGEGRPEREKVTTTRKSHRKCGQCTDALGCRQQQIEQEKGIPEDPVTAFGRHCLFILEAVGGIAERKQHFHTHLYEAWWPGQRIFPITPMRRPLP